MFFCLCREVPLQSIRARKLAESMPLAPIDVVILSHTSTCTLHSSASLPSDSLVELHHHQIPRNSLVTPSQHQQTHPNPPSPGFVNLRHLHPQRLADTVPLSRHTIREPAPHDGNVFPAACTQDRLQLEAATKRLITSSHRLYNPGLLLQHIGWRPHQLIHPQRRPAKHPGCETETQGEEQGCLPTGG